MPPISCGQVQANVPMAQRPVHSCCACTAHKPELPASQPLVPTCNCRHDVETRAGQRGQRVINQQPPPCWPRIPAARLLHRLIDEHSCSSCPGPCPCCSCRNWIGEGAARRLGGRRRGRPGGWRRWMGLGAGGRWVRFWAWGRRVGLRAGGRRFRWRRLGPGRRGRRRGRLGAGRWRRGRLWMRWRR